MGTIRIHSGIHALADNGFRFQGQQRVWREEWTGHGGGNPGLVDVTDAGVAIDFGDVSPGWIELQNLDGENNVEYGPDDTGIVPLGLLLPNAAPQRIYLASGATLVLQTAATETAKVLVQGFDA